MDDNTGKFNMDEIRKPSGGGYTEKMEGGFQPEGQKAGGKETFSDYETYTQTNEEVRYQNNNSGKNNLTKEDVIRVVRDEISRNSKPNKWGLRAFALILIGSILGSLITGFFLNRSDSGSDQAVITESSNTGTSVITINTSEEVNVEKAVALKSIPSVVGISTMAMSEDFFMQSEMVEGIGSGVIVSADGYILTNSHVIRDGNAESIDVLFDDGSTERAQLLWFDTTLDLAVVKVQKQGLTPIEFADSQEVSVGDKAIAIGNPLGLDLQSTLTSGYISGLNRSITLNNGLTMDSLIQTDAAINSGNSGGALLNREGKLIGINTAKAEGGEGIGFAIPINIAKPIVDQIIKTGKYESVYLGISGTDVSIYERLASKDLGQDSGIIIYEIIKNSGADKAGLRSGDIITKIDGKVVEGMSQLKQLLLNYQVGDTVRVTYYRDNQEKTVDVTFQPQ